ncbi:MAG: alcohol dehydrogenase catalytic domain-containing protein [Clostridia bacterium]|nr:alcohol dehydrogenase catalytic domain-containing protein [Clostridia bacterium]
MKAAVWLGDNQVEVREVPIPEIGEEEALLKVRAAGVCATDYHIVSGFLKIGKAPNIQGHEICGEVVKINSKRTDIPIGQRCVVATSIGCGYCDACREGKAYLCNESSEIGYYPHNGGYAEFVKVPVSAIVPISDKVSDKAGAILESTVCPTESLMRIGIPFAGSVVVAGTGPAGLAFIMVAKLMGAGKIITLVRDEKSTVRAFKYGATHVVNIKTSPDPVREVAEITDGKKADVVIEATGAKPMIESMPNYVKKGGNIILYGIPSDSDEIVFPVTKMIVEEISVHGAVGNTKAWYPLAKMIESGRLDLESLVTHEFALEDINKAFDLYRNHDKTLIKAIIKF